MENPFAILTLLRRRVSRPVLDDGALILHSQGPPALSDLLSSLVSHAEIIKGDAMNHSAHFLRRRTRKRTGALTEDV